MVASPARVGKPRYDRYDLTSVMMATSNMAACGKFADYYTASGTGPQRKHRHWRLHLCLRSGLVRLALKFRSRNARRDVHGSADPASRNAGRCNDRSFFRHGYIMRGVRLDAGRRRKIAARLRAQLASQRPPDRASRQTTVGAHARQTDDRGEHTRLALPVAGRSATVITDGAAPEGETRCG